MNSKNNIQLIIPMSGLGQRFVDKGYQNPKPLIDIDGSPIIKHVVDLFEGVSDIIFICNEKHLKETNMLSVLKSISPNAQIFSIPCHKKGPVYAVSKIFDNINDKKEIIISYCDYGTVWDFDEFLAKARSENFDGSIPCYKGFHPHMLGSDNYAFCKENDKVLVEIKEKEPFTGDKMQEYASNGTYYFKTGRLVKKFFQKALDLKCSINGEYYVSLVYNLLVSEGLKVNIFEIEKMLQWGTPYDLEIYKSWLNYFSSIKKRDFKPKAHCDTTLILPMAGKGSRFEKEGYNKPKPLIDLDGSPMAIKALESLPQCKDQIFVALQEHDNLYQIKDQIKRFYPKSNTILIGGPTEGQACTTCMAIEESKLDLDQPILVSACDNGAYYDVDAYMSLYNDESIDIIVWSFRNNQASKVNPDMYSWLDVDQNDNIKHVHCKNFIFDDPLKCHAIIGTMFFRKARYFIEGFQRNLKQNIRTNGEFYVDDILNQNINMGLNVKVFEVEHYICWGTPNDYKTYNYWKDHFDKS